MTVLSREATLSMIKGLTQEAKAVEAEIRKHEKKIEKLRSIHSKMIVQSAQLSNSIKGCK